MIDEIPFLFALTVAALSTIAYLRLESRAARAG